MQAKPTAASCNESKMDQSTKSSENEEQVKSTSSPSNSCKEVSENDKRNASDRENPDIQFSMEIKSSPSTVNCNKVDDGFLQSDSPSNLVIDEGKYGENIKLSIEGNLKKVNNVLIHQDCDQQKHKEESKVLNKPEQINSSFDKAIYNKPNMSANFMNGQGEKPNNPYSSLVSKQNMFPNYTHWMTHMAKNNQNQAKTNLAEDGSLNKQPSPTLSNKSSRSNTIQMSPNATHEIGLTSISGKQLNSRQSSDKNIEKYRSSDYPSFYNNSPLSKTQNLSPNQKTPNEASSVYNNQQALDFYQKFPSSNGNGFRHSTQFAAKNEFYGHTGHKSCSPRASNLSVSSPFDGASSRASSTAPGSAFNSASQPAQGYIQDPTDQSSTCRGSQMFGNRFYSENNISSMGSEAVSAAAATIYHGNDLNYNKNRFFPNSTQSAYNQAAL